MSCGINSFKNRIAVNQSVKVKDGSGGFELNSTLLLTVWSMVEATEEKPEEIDEGRNTRSVWYDVTTRLSPMLDTLHRLNSLFFVVDGGKTIYPKSYKIKGNLVTFKATYSYDDSVIPVYSPIAAPSGWDAQIAEYGRGANLPISSPITSYRLGDAASIEASTFAPIRVANSLKVKNSLIDFFTLGNKNNFGNTKRFTDELGTEVFANSYIIDNFTEIAYYLNLDFLKNTDWNNTIDYAEGLTYLTYSDYFVPSFEQYASFLNFADQNTLNYAPFSTTLLLWTSTTNDTTTTSAYIIRPLFNVGLSIAKTTVSSSVSSLIARKHIF